MKAEIVNRARELGFDACRVDRAAVPDHAGQFRRWLADGRHGTMAYLERTAAKRTNPALVLPAVRSVVVLAVSYHRAAGELGSDGHGPRAIVARYARYADYHEVLAPRLRELSGFIDQRGGSGARSLGYVDTGPVLERDLAQRAGIGFIGKHANLIHRGLGNWFFLASILTTVELEPDPPEPNRCGRCVRCLQACPTAAIVAPFQLDARRCLSYLTIEFRGPIPEEFRPALGARVFGCDDCLEACPWNRFAREGRIMRQAIRSDLDQASLTEWLGLDDAAFRRRFEGTPLMRAKRRGLLRNVCVALGNVGDRSVLAALARAAADPEPLIASHAAWAIDRIEGRTRSA